MKNNDDLDALLMESDGVRDWYVVACVNGVSFI
jgi:hypothetical protein